MNTKVWRQLQARERRIIRRLGQADRTRAINAGGIGAAHLLVKRLGLAQAINERLDLLKVHLPYLESDHNLNIAYQGSCL